MITKRYCVVREFCDDIKGGSTEYYTVDNDLRKTYQLYKSKLQYAYHYAGNDFCIFTFKGFLQYVPEKTGVHKHEDTVKHTNNTEHEDTVKHIYENTHPELSAMFDDFEDNGLPF